MRKAIFAALILSATAPIYGRADAPQQQTEQKSQAFSDDEKRQALEALKNISAAFGDNKPEQVKDQKASSGKTDDHKTMGDVADKALDISTKYIGQVVGVLEKAAPHVWRVMVMQQYAKAASGLVGPLMFILTIVLAAFTTRRFWQEPDDLEQLRKGRCSSDEHDARIWVTLMIPIVFCIGGGFYFAYNLADAVSYLVNPEYYAIKDLVNLLLNHGSM